MRKIMIRAVVVMMTIISLICCLPMNAMAATPLDEIESYIVKVNMRNDGTMDINYHIEWKVLDSTSEGPLEWIKVGIPNKQVDEISGHSNNIKEIKYINDGGSYVRIDFNKKYNKGEIANIDFSIHQSYMYILEEDQHICRYSFTPGWFDDIEIKGMKIMWAETNVLDSTATLQDDGFLIWEKSNLKPGARMNASVRYNYDVFDTDINKQFVEEEKNRKSEKSDDGISWVWILIGITVIVFIITVVCFIFDDDDYHGGWGGGSHTYIHTHSSCVRSSCAHSSCACASHCACACACAGGGRAGCSIKDTYKGGNRSDNKDDINSILEVLKRD